MTRPASLSKKKGLTFLLAVVASIATVVVWRAALFRHRLLDEMTRRASASSLGAAEALASWRSERSADAILVATVAALPTTGPGDRSEGRRDATRAVLANVIQHGQFARGRVWDGSGTLLLSHPANRAESGPLEPDWTTLFSPAPAIGQAIVRAADRAVLVSFVAIEQDSHQPPSRRLVALDADLTRAFAGLVEHTRGASRTGRTTLAIPYENGLLSLTLPPGPTPSALLNRFAAQDMPPALALAVRTPGAAVRGNDHRGTRVLAVGNPVEGSEWTVIRHADLSEILAPVRAQIALLSVAGLAVLGLVVAAAFAYHRTVRLRALRTVAESEAQLAAILASAPDPMIAANAEGRILLFNAAAERTFNIPAPLAIGMQLTAFVPGPQTNPGQPAGDGHPTAVRTTGEVFPCEIAASTAEVGGYRTTTVIVRDLTERLQLEQQARQAARLEAVGYLAGGVAHEFNNVMTDLLLASELLAERTGNDAEAKDEAGRIRDAVRRAAALTSQLTAFTGKHLLRLSAFDVNAQLNEHAESYREMIVPGTLRLDLADNLPLVLADRTLLHQALGSLLTNAREAEARVVTIRTHAASNPGGAAVVLEVADDGLGLDAAVATRAVEPFFTTKDRATHAGLGLSVVHGLVRQIGGSVSVAGSVDRGATVTMTIPAAPVSSADPPPGPPRSDAGDPHRAARVMIVDDEPGIRRAVAQVLVRQGYEVLVAEDGAAALATLQDAQGLDCLITDLTMPGTGGRELAEHVSARFPDVRVVFISGYTEDELARRSLADPRVAFLRKPFELAEIVAAVRTVLTSPTGRPA